MTRSIQLVRLLASVTVALGACLFVVLYDQFSYIRYPFDHPDAEGHLAAPHQFILANRPPGSEFLTAHRAHAYVVPIVGLLIGILVIWRWSQFPALAELVVSAMWVLAFLWAGFAIVMWQVQNVPLFHGMRFHW